MIEMLISFIRRFFATEYWLVVHYCEEKSRVLHLRFYEEREARRQAVRLRVNNYHWFRWLEGYGWCRQTKDIYPKH